MASVAFYLIISTMASAVVLLFSPNTGVEWLNSHKCFHNIPLDASITSREKQREETHMLKLRTVHPYGLNDCLEDEHKKENTYALLGYKFQHLPRKHDRVSRGTILGK